MIDIENHVFDHVSADISGVLPSGNFKSMYVPSASSFPFATLMEVNNSTNTRFRSTAVDEDFSTVVYEANIYAMTKPECRNVADAIDTSMTRMNFTRMSMTFTPNLADPAIYRITARYRATVDKNNVLYRFV